jgi:hypothetical protein
VQRGPHGPRTGLERGPGLRGPAWPAGPGLRAPTDRPPDLLVGLVEEDAVDWVRLLEVHRPLAQLQVVVLLAHGGRRGDSCSPGGGRQLRAELGERRRRGAWAAWAGGVRLAGWGEAAAIPAGR